VTILPLAGVQVEVQVADECAAFILIVPYAEDLDILVPCDVIFAILCLKLE
jgi:hypothetical protein